MTALREILKKHGLSQKTLADKMGKTEEEISRWCNNRHEISMKNALKVVAALDGYGVTLQELYGLDEVSHA